MNLFDVIVEIVNIVLNLIIEFMFFSSLWNKKYNKLITIATFTVISFLFLMVKLFFNAMLASYISMFALTLMLTFLFESKFLHKLIYTAILHSIMAIIEMMVAMVITTVFSLDFLAGKEGVLYISGIILSKFVLFLTVILIRLKKQSVLLENYKKSYFGVFLFPLASLIIILLQHKIFSDNPHQSITIQYFVLLGYTILILSNILVFDFIDTIYTKTVAESKLSIANELINSQAKQYQTLLENNEKIIKLRHDHKNFCVGIMSELKAGNVENAIAILDKEYNLSKNESLLYGNVVTSIINIKQQAASENNISLLCDYVDASKINIKPTDLAILLGNALDNAIDACKLIPETEKKYIETDISVKNDTVYIMIKNPTCGKVDVNNLTSTKAADPSRHGFGIASMKQIAEKYCGEVLFSLEDDIFNTVIMLKNLV